MAKTLADTVYALEPLSYYFGMKPKEFWDSRFKEVNLYCEMNLIRTREDYKNNIILNDATTDKLLRGDCMNTKAKVIPLRKMFKDIFT